MTKLELIEEKIKSLPAKALEDVEKYVDSLSKSLKTNTRKYLKQDWAGCLKEDKDKYTSVELQHLISKQWGRIYQ